MKSECIFNTMQVLETKPISDLITEATIKVCYVSQTPNRNKTVITKQVGKEIAATLPGAPVVGLFDSEANDFVQHSRKITITDGDLKIEDLTRPYGFVSFDAPWYQDFLEDGIKRTYLMCKAYLWTKQYPEAQKALGKGQSMELNENELTGYYEGDVFIFTHATTDKLCILGDKYEPCFEGASILTTYARQYNNFAEDVEQVLGRRYFVLNGQLMPMEKNTISYALKLGFDLEEAVRNQLVERGATDYEVVGIFAEAGKLFVIARNEKTTAYVRVGITINPDDTVVLDSEMRDVAMTWAPKAPVDDSKADPIQGAPGSDNGNPTPTPRSAEEYQALLNQIQELQSQIEANSNGSEIAANYTQQIEELEAKNNEFTQHETELNGQIETLTTQVGEFTSREEELNNQILALTEQVTNLTTELDGYKCKAREDEKKKKHAMVQSFANLLSEDDITSVETHIDEYSLDDIEKELSVLYARHSKDRIETTPTQYQLNVNLNDNNNSQFDEIPGFLQQAIEYDQSHQF